MSDQDRTQATTKRRSSRSASKQNDMQVGALQRAAKDDSDTWKAHWEKQGQPWRTEQEIDEERQKYLIERRSITPDVEKSIYPLVALSSVGQMWNGSWQHMIMDWGQ